MPKRKLLRKKLLPKIRLTLRKISMLLLLVKNFPKISKQKQELSLKQQSKLRLLHLEKNSRKNMKQHLEKKLLVLKKIL